MKKIIVESCLECFNLMECKAKSMNSAECPIPDDRTAELEAEVAELKAWKESALSIMPDYQRIGELLDVPIGESVHDKIVPGIERLKTQLADAIVNIKFVDYYIRTIHLDMGGHHRYTLAGWDRAMDAVKKMKAWLAGVE